MDLRRERLSPVDMAGGVFLGAIALPGDPARAVFVFKSGFPPENLGHAEGCQITVARSIAEGIAVTAEVEITDGTIPLPLREPVPPVRPSPVETRLFADMNCAVALWNGEDPQAVVEWLDYHSQHHDLQGVVLIDRSPDADAKSALDRALAEADLPDLDRLVILDPGAPTGRPDLGPEADLYYAPDAPGKDRMTEPGPDPWRAPFQEVVLYEYVRHRFLDRARAVMNLDVTDLLPPSDSGVSVFDMAVAAHGGLVQLVGIRCYPWALKKKESPSFGAHLCRPFDKVPANPRWCIAPARLPEEAVWRLIRVVGAQAVDGLQVKYYRAMGLRHPEAKIAAMAPKTSLIVDEVMEELATEYFGGKPQYPPEEDLAPRAKRGGSRTGIVTTMKNEGPFILEWIAYHRAIGIEDFLVYTNDCTDGTDTMLELLQSKGIVQHRDNPFREVKMKPQHAALHAADGEPWLDALDWVICMDVDEFISIHVGDGRLDDLYAAVGDANLISMNWRLFGNADLRDFEDRFIVEQFTRCAPEFIRKPHQAWGFKTLARNIGLFKKLGVHRPKGLKPQLVDAVNWVNGSGKPFPEKMYRNAWRTGTSTYGYELVTLNHYAVRSAESFLVKRDRGRVNHVDRDQGLAYWFRMNNNAEEDLAIQRMIPGLQAEYDRLLSDPEIAEAHAHAVRMHREKIEELKKRPDQAEFFEDLTSTRMKRLSRMHRHFGAGVFLAGPQVIPDHVVEQDPMPEDFFFTVKHEEQAH